LHINIVKNAEMSVPEFFWILPKVSICIPSSYATEWNQWYGSLW